MSKIIKNIPYEKIDYGVHMLNAISQWDKTKGENVNVAILDTGIDFTHFELRKAVKGGINFTTPDYKDYMDRNGHGTFCAGIIAGSNNNKGIVGIAPKCNLYAVKVLADCSKGSLYWLAQGIDWCIHNNIHIMSMSLGYNKDIVEIHNLIKEAHSKGIIMLGASGNDNTKKEIDFPARYKEVIGITAIDNKRKLGNFCTTGKDIEFAAPGVNITSTYLNNTFAVMSGTSMATPHIAGAIALIQSKNLKENGCFLNLEQIQDYLRSKSLDLGSPGKNNEYGYGMFHF